jgi:hypothetical protein
LAVLVETASVVKVALSETVTMTVVAIAASVTVAGSIEHDQQESIHLYCIFDDLKGRHGSDPH